jgi:hypothetical protein
MSLTGCGLRPEEAATMTTNGSDAYAPANRAFGNNFNPMSYPQPDLSGDPWSSLALSPGLRARLIS